jgi:hypothetical protein
MTDAAAFRAAVKEAEATHGPVDCLINNAGLMLLGQIDTQDPMEWQRMYYINVLALLNAMQAVLARNPFLTMPLTWVPNLPYPPLARTSVKRWLTAAYAL